MKNTDKKILSVSGWCLILLTVLFAFSQAYAQGGGGSVVVNTLAEGDDGVCDSTNCTLREAVNYAPAGAAITFSVQGIIDVRSNIVINKNLTVTGPGANLLTLRGNLTKNGSQGSSLFEIRGGVVGISGLTLREGSGTDDNSNQSFGGAVYVSGGTVTLSNNVLANNFAQNGGGIALTGGSLNVVGCTISYDDFQIQSTHGAGIYVSNGSTLAVTDTTITGNRAFYGGGIYVEGGTVSIASSTISGNTAIKYNTTGGLGGGIFSSYSSGGIPAKVTISNSTISGNIAQDDTGVAASGGGGIWNQGTLTVTNSTLTNNISRYYGGGILDRGAGPVSLSNTIVAGNFANKSYPDILGPKLAADSFNFIGGSPMLGPLQNNGGPTFTHAPLSGSPVLDAGDPNFDASKLPFDQRGAASPRVKNGRLDIGAVEGNEVILFVNSLADTDDGVCSVVTICTLRDAVKYAPAGANISFNVSGTITLTNGEIVIDKNLTISGPANASGITISGNNKSRIFTITGTSAMTVDLSALKLTGGNGVSSLSGGVGSRNGGAIYIDRATVKLTNSTLSGNSVTGGNGGAIYIDQATVKLTNSTLSGNSVTGNGGALRSNSNLTVTNSTISGNTAGVTGGAIRAGGTLNITNSTISGNDAPSGGGIYNNSGTINLTGATIAYNTAATSGGGVFNSGGTTNLLNTIVADNNTANGQPEIAGGITSQGNNLFKDASVTASTSTDKLGLSARLAPLGNYGGATQTHALTTTSPAINAGTATNALTTDQRGASRVIANTNPDIGAFELNNSQNNGSNGYRVVTQTGRQTVPFNYQLTANSGAFSYSITGGTLPPGLSLSSSFVAGGAYSITGTPSATGTYNYTVTASDGTNSVATDYTTTIQSPTAAAVTVSGRVVTAKGARGIRNAVVTMTDQDGTTRYATTTTFGYFRFSNVAAGATYVFGVRAKRFTFEQNTTVRYLDGDADDLVFTAY